MLQEWSPILSIYSVIIALELVLTEKQNKQTLAQQVGLKIESLNDEIITSKKRKRTEMSSLTLEEE